MTTATLSLKIFPQDADFRFDGWQNEFRNLIQMFFDGEELPGVLPDFKGFTKDFNRANWFQPLYEGALARKPLVVRIEADDQYDFTHGQYSGWQHKIRLAWHSVCNEFRNATQTVLDKPVTVALSTSALPLTVKDTEAYKVALELHSKCLQPAYSNLRDSKLVSAEKEANETLGYMLEAQINFAGDSEHVKTMLQKFLARSTALLFIGGTTEDKEVQHFSENFTTASLVTRFFWHLAKEMGLDVQDIYETTTWLNPGGFKKNVASVIANAEHGQALLAYFHESF